MQLSKKKELNKENILSLVDEYTILKTYYPADRKLEMNKAILSPFRGEDSPSFIVGNKYGNIVYKDMGDSYFKGDIWNFVKQIKGLRSFNDVLVSINETLGLGLNGNGEKGTGKIIIHEKPLSEVRKPIIIQAALTSRSAEGEAYLSEYGLTLKDLNIFKDTKVGFAKELFINKIRQSIGKFCLIYNLKNERGNWIKAYRPLGRKDSKWRTNIPFIEMHGIDEIVGCETVVLSKSVKDASILTKYLGLCTTVIQAEDISAISGENLEVLKSIPNLYISTDNDKKGKEVSWNLTTALNCKHVNPPDNLAEQGITDFADMARVLGIQSVINHFKEKNII